VWKYWWLVVVGGVGGVLTMVSFVAGVSLSTWTGLAILFVGLSVAQFLAFKDMRDERNRARDTLRTALAPLLGSEFVRQKLRLADIGRDLIRGGDTPVITGCRFTECTITGPGFFTMIHSTMQGCGWDSPLDAFFVEIPPPRRVVGVILFLDCVFERCGFEGVGLIGDAELGELMRNGIIYGA
jgi:hypothetical protein